MAALGKVNAPQVEGMLKEKISEFFEEHQKRRKGRHSYHSYRVKVDIVSLQYDVDVYLYR